MFKNDYFLINFKIGKKGNLISIRNKGKDALQVSFIDSLLRVDIYYEENEKPLTLASIAYINDEVTLKFYPYRIELILNGKVEDEEWPFGKALYIDADYSEGEYRAEAFVPEERNEPIVKGCFQNAENWKPEGNVYVGDCMPYVYKGRYHVLYLKDRHNHRSKWGKGAHQWEHISTDDFISWQIHPMAVEITDPKEGSICTGSFIESENKQYLYYTIRMSDGTSAPIMRSVASDCYHFEKDADFKFYLSEKYKGESARDPKVIKDSDGLYHMFVTTTLLKERKGCLVHLTSTDNENWLEEEKPIYIAETNEEPECPDYFEYKGYYYLIFSLKGKAHYLYSKKPFTDWIEPKDPIIPCKTVPKAAVYNDRIIFTGYNNLWQNLYAGTMTFKEAETDKNHELKFN